MALQPQSHVATPVANTSEIEEDQGGEVKLQTKLKKLEARTDILQAKGVVDSNAPS
jgi:hypothetical protein